LDIDDVESVEGKGLVKEQTLLRSVDTPILTTFLQSTIFMPTKKGLSRGIDNYREIEIKKSSYETIKVSGPYLDMNKDFPIWATVLKEVDRTGSYRVSIPENELLSRIGYSVNNINAKNKAEVEKKIENMMKVHVKIVLKDMPDDPDCTYFISVIPTGKWDRHRKRFEFTINEDLFFAYKKIKWKALDLDYYMSLKTDYAKALFCFYESHSDKTIPFKREVLLARLGLDKYARKNNAYQKLKLAHENLKDIGYLKYVECSKNKNDGNYYYKVSKTPKRSRKDIMVKQDLI
jgi:hypothetical protein